MAAAIRESVSTEPHSSAFPAPATVVLAGARSPSASRVDPAAPPKLRESLLVTVISVAAMVGLYSGLDARNTRLLAAGETLFTPLTPLDAAIPLVVPFVWIYYAYFPLTLSLHVVTRARREWLYEALSGYLLLAVTGFCFFALVPSQMPQPSLAACASADCRALDLMYRSDDGFHAFPSMHVAYSVYVALFFRDHAPKKAWLPTLLALGIAASTLLCKRHFVVDVPVGALLAFAARPIARRLRATTARVFRFAA